MHTNANSICLYVKKKCNAIYRLESWRMGDGGTYELVKYIPSWTKLLKLRYDN